MQLFVDVSGSAILSAPKFEEFLTYLALNAEGRYFLFDHEIKCEGQISEIMEDHILAGNGGTDPTCLLDHLGSDHLQDLCELKIMITDGLMANFQSTNLLLVNPIKIQYPSRFARMLVSLDDELQVGLVKS